jgi:hypothetical protein
MVDVVVDEKPMTKLPYDPAVIPPAVRKRAEAVNALYGQNAPDAAQQPSGEQPGPPQVAPVEAPAVQVPASPVTVPPTPASSAPVAPPPSPPSPPDADANSETWKSRYMGLQGRWQTSQRQIGEMQNQLEQLGTELMHVQQNPRQRKRAPVPTPNFLTPEDEQNYGRDLLDVAQRAALQVVAPKVHEIELQNKDLQGQLAKERRRGLDQAVELAVPDFREIDRNPRWHRWLLGIDVFTGTVRQRLLDDAIASASAPRVISFFNSFKAEEAATGHVESAPSSTQMNLREPAVSLASLATPGRARSATGGDASLPADRPTYTRVQIKQLYEQHRKGAYLGREAEWARLEADLFAAQREGRIRS